MKYYIEVGSNNKAKIDIDKICQDLGFSNLTQHNFGQNAIGRFLTKVVSVTRIATSLHHGDQLFLQYPMKKFYYLACILAHWRGAHVVTIIHDLGAFRRHKLTPEHENDRLSKTDFLIVHNSTMRDYLKEHGYKGGMHCLQIFDYLSPCMPASYPTPHHPWRIVYAGNLGRWRNNFLYHMKDIVGKWTLDLYGNGFDVSENNCDKVNYHGFIKSDDFISNAEADFGIVWDGDSTSECTGDWGEYLRINNPHKASFYLRAGIPIIVWSKSAMLPFVRDNKIGIIVNSLSDIDDCLAKLNPTEYNKMKSNVKNIGQKLADGYFIKQGLAAADNYLKEKIQ